MTIPFDFGQLCALHQQRSGIRCGWPTEADYARLAYNVYLHDLCADALGYENFQRVYQRVRHFAENLADGDFLLEAVNDDATHARVGYLLHAAHPSTAANICKFYHQVAAHL